MPSPRPPAPHAGHSPRSQRQDTDVYCGVVPADVWPFGRPLVVELEVRRGSFTVTAVHVSEPLAGLRRHLRRLLVGVPVGGVSIALSDKSRAVYRSPLWKWVEAALIFAVGAFREERPDDYLGGQRRDDQPRTDAIDEDTAA